MAANSMNDIQSDIHKRLLKDTEREFNDFLKKIIGDPNIPPKPYTGTGMHKTYKAYITDFKKIN